MVRKKTGQWRLCVDFRQINARSVKDAYPMPMINYILYQLREEKYISSLDLKDGYWQIPLEERSRQDTAFTVPGKGLFQWKVMFEELDTQRKRFDLEWNHRATTENSQGESRTRCAG